MNQIGELNEKPLHAALKARTVQKPHPKYFTLEKRLYSSGHHLLVE